MLVKPITYTNFNGQQVTKDFYFNLTKAELAMRELESDGTWSETLAKISASDKGSVVMPEFRKILKWTYGEKSEDGESFFKSDEVWARFENSEPYSVLIMELLQNGGYSAEFINAILPPDIAAKNREAQAVKGFRPGANTERPTPPVAGGAGTPGSLGVPQGQQDTAPAQPVQFSAPQEVQPPQQYQTPTAGPDGYPYGGTPVPDAAVPAEGVTQQSTPRTDLFPGQAPQQ